MPEARTRPLPKGWTVKEDHAIGVTYFDDTGRMIVQHPYDSDAGLALAVGTYRSRCTPEQWQQFVEANK